jgi:hypothetical protein
MPLTGEEVIGKSFINYDGEFLVANVNGSSAHRDIWKRH